MAITKTNFINYSRCPRYVALDNLKKDKLNSMVSLEEYKKEEEKEILSEILTEMVEQGDLIDKTDEQLEVMLPYYNEVELLTGAIAYQYFPGTFKYSKETLEQESFDFVAGNIRYLCYVDIYNEVEDGFNIIEVKATTSKKFLDLGFKIKGKFHSIFTKKNNIYCLSSEIRQFCPKNYDKQVEKLFDRYSPSGKYVYDLAVQRYIIENDLKQNGSMQNVKYYLAVLNADYVFDGTYENEKPIYNKDTKGNDIVCFFDMTDITSEYLSKIDIDRKNVEGYITSLKADKVPLGKYCQYKSKSGCKFCPICFQDIPKKNSIMNYIDSSFGFKDSSGKKYGLYELINNGYTKMLDIPLEMLNRKKNVIQRKVVSSGEVYVDYDKIKDGLTQVKYPIYHLDFETFPCPLPRYRGEKCYSQSVFQFSLHIEREKGKCDKEKDHYEYLAPDHTDRRIELVSKLCEYIKDNGTVLVYNDSFEKTRLKELAQIFPEYSDKLLHIREMVFDLMNIVKTKGSLYESLGYSKERALMFNYYHKDMSGSFSIKKVLPLFSNLSYKEMEIGNGVDALVTYAKFPKMDKTLYKHKYLKLVEYCKQDTWAMVCILDGLRDYVK